MNNASEIAKPFMFAPLVVFSIRLRTLQFDKRNAAAVKNNHSVRHSAMPGAHPFSLDATGFPDSANQVLLNLFFLHDANAIPRSTPQTMTPTITHNRSCFRQVLISGIRW